MAVGSQAASEVEVRAAFSMYVQLLLRRLGYLRASKRLSPAGLAELDHVLHQVWTVNGALPEAVASTIDRESGRSWLRDAYKRELDRYGALVISDAKAARQRSSVLLVQAKCACAGASKSQRPALRVVKDPEPMSFQLLDRIVAPFEEATA